MKTYLRNALAIFVGFILGSVVNMTNVQIGHAIFPLPPDADMSTPEGMRAVMETLTAKDFIFPFLGHALGTLVGAFCAGKLSVSHKLGMSMGIGVMFLLGGLAMVMMIGGPKWFIALDLLVAYLPMAYLGGVLAVGKGCSGRHQSGAARNSSGLPREPC